MNRKQLDLSIDEDNQLLVGENATAHLERIGMALVSKEKLDSLLKLENALKNMIADLEGEKFANALFTPFMVTLLLKSLYE